MILLFSKVVNQMSPKTHGTEHTCTLQQKRFRVMSLVKVQEELVTVDMPVNQKSLLCPKRVSQKSCVHFWPSPRTIRRLLAADSRAGTSLRVAFCHGHGAEKRMEFHSCAMTAIPVMTHYDFEQNPPFQVC